MLEMADLKEIMTKEAYRELAKIQKEQLVALQQTIKQYKIPVVILFEGWGTAGKGSLISKLILNLDPRGFKVYSTADPTETEKRYPRFWRYWQRIPAWGNMAIFDRSWYQEIGMYRVQQNISDKEWKKRIQYIRQMEQTLTDNGYVVLKFFLHISKNEQRKRLKKLAADSHTKWRVSKKDLRCNEEYDTYYKAFDEMLEKTSTANAPWHIIPSHNRYVALTKIYRDVINAINAEAGRKQAFTPVVDSGIENPASLYTRYPTLEMPKLSEVDLNKSLTEAEYSVELKKAQKRLRQLHQVLYHNKIPVIICYEGWDAAGKGGNIKRVAAALDPRGYEVVPVAAPNKDELARHFLWRFWKNLPKDGHVAIFDRTWYGRVMVERLEGFCTRDDWTRAYNEMNAFEDELVGCGAIVIKFWIHIDKDEQLVRFTARQNTPSKQWKITDEDWRNRDKWDQYEIAVNDMLKYTSTPFAPWHIIESNDKKYARVKTIRIINDTIIDELRRRGIDPDGKPTGKEDGKKGGWY